MSDQKRPSPAGIEQRYLAIIFTAVAITVFLITWTGIRESRSDSARLLVMQGEAFIEVLAQATDNTIVSETFYDFLIHQRFSEIAVPIQQEALPAVTDEMLIDLAVDHSLYGAFLFRADSTLAGGGIVRGSLARLPDYVIYEVNQLIADPENNFVLLLDEGDSPDEMIHYYLEISNTLDRVVVLVADALYYTEALQQTQVGYLAQKMAHEEGVEYIIYQTTEGIVFSSRRAGKLLAIESDPFLADALESEHIASRRYNFQNREVLELVRPFSTADYPFGLLRVGLSLENYQSIIRGYHFQMITLAVILFSLVLVVVMYSNSRRKRAEIARKYKRIKSISDTIFENMRTGVAALDAHGKIVLANDAFESILHLHNVDGKQWDTAVTEPLLSFEAISPGSGVSHELELEIGHEGAKKSLLIAVSRMLAESEGLQGLVVVVYDITRIKELEAKSARRERLSEMGNLAAGVAHEIRNPLNTISIAAQRLAAEYAPTDQSDEFLSFTRQIKEETRRLNEIITRFLALTREDRESRTSVDLSRLITEFTQFIMPEAQDLGIVVKARIESGLTISAGPDNVKQILSNLYNNAKEALTGRAGEINIAARKHRGQVLLEFADNGPGIDPTLREKAFTPYYTTKEAGTGLGLPTVYRIVSDLSGDIRIEQSETGGVSIVINFPV